ncbi:acyl-CoA reductase-like NAD-dependent aldehyde dehydrogenase [Rhizorhapis suberifaciens]|uniref:Acyl-CoA reductase-like NAD-dependent aldehyde dehydrogenase n=1 Tax=Rhizorhapis suberifaciens TaxID=13656 RepID=A0A840HUA5_9SPHN|nr:acyl-CoA reductase-like NAD-dependent aldehyde dehydrogenase [Rhizorhapis suberifaciens]
MAVPKLSDPSLFADRAYINGEWRPAASGATIAVEDPATGEVIGHIPNCDGSDTRSAIDAANAAFGPWRTLPAGERAVLLECWYDLIMANIGDLGRIMTAEQGKPIAEAEGEIRYAASFIKWFAEEGRRVVGSSVPAPTSDRRILIMKEPVGVAAAITPWNFPAAMITRKCAPALASGCPIVVKPSESTPFTALALARLAAKAGFPAGVVNVVTGSAQAIGAEMSSNPMVRKLSFTGSTRIGSLLMKQCADTVKRLSLELGGMRPSSSSTTPILTSRSKAR